MKKRKSSVKTATSQSHHSIDELKVGTKIPINPHGHIEIMAYAHGYYMIRFAGGIPFCYKKKEVIGFINRAKA